MILSMTGYGKSEVQWEDKNIRIEIRSLNSKTADINLRIPSYLRELESELRKRITQLLFRGKIDVSIYVEYNGGNAPTTNRFEQELIFYLEKFDITEEKVRLKNHLDYFKKIMKSDDPVGKKLGFIAQEMGREINTIGSKANHAALQKIVVQMKDELEKIKEQLLNVL
jgi:uncharacterized protein YicC (UPF0701 family)